MSKRRLILTVLVACASMARCDSPARPALEEETRPALEDALPSERQTRFIPNHYIVVFNDDVTDPPGVARRLARTHGLELRHSYSTALKGFAAAVPPGRVDALRADPRVRYVTLDQMDQVHQQEGLPTGIDRVEADLNPTWQTGDVDVDIAILDTGIDLDHPDLNVFQAVAFAGGNPDDGNGHGTHVAGTAAAKHGGTVVGVAPGARLWAVKVCRNNGRCDRSDIIAGIDFVAQHGSEIEVANMSLGGVGFDDGDCGHSGNDPEHQAICAAVSSGVVFVVSAGNARSDAANYAPASYDEVLTVSALADFDGLPGGAAGPGCTEDEDDSFASFSNFGADVDLMAPGVCILSTWKQGGTNTLSGTSQAAPHVTGAVALYVAANYPNGLSSGAEARTVMGAVVDAGIEQLERCGLSHFDDPDGIAEPLVFANAEEIGGDGNCTGVGPAAGDIAITDVAAPGTAVPGAVVDVTVTVANTSAIPVTEEILVVLESDNGTTDPADDILIGTVSIDGMAVGEDLAIPFSWTTVGADAGVHTLTATHSLADADPGNNSGTTTVTLEGPALRTTHVGNLDRASTRSGGGTWTAWARITIHDASEAVLHEGSVTGSWAGGAMGTSTCYTQDDGFCEVSSPPIASKDGSATFTVGGVYLAGTAYDPSSNHDPDGNSHGTTIRVFANNSDDYKK